MEAAQCFVKGQVARRPDVGASQGHQQVDVEHLLASMLEQERGLAPSLLNKAEINFDGIKSRVEQELEL